VWQVDDDHVGYLEGEDVMIALRGVNNRLTEAEEEYLYRVGGATCPSRWSHVPL